MTLTDKIVNGLVVGFFVLVTYWMIASTVNQMKANDDYQRGLTVSGIDVMFASQVSHDAGYTGKEADEHTFKVLKGWQADRAERYAKEHK